MSMSNSTKSLVIGAVIAAMLGGTPALAQSAPPVSLPVFAQSVAAAAASDEAIATFYRENDYRPLWTGEGAQDRARLQALLRAFDNAADHGLPAHRYATDTLRADLARITSERDLGRVEVELSRLFLRYARDVQTGILTPGRVDGEIVRDVPLRDPLASLRAFAASAPDDFIRALPPASAEYTRLMKGKFDLEQIIAQGGWGMAVPTGTTLRPGDTGPVVVALRDRLVAMGYLRRSASVEYDAQIQAAVQAFQTRHGLAADGIAGPSTIGELNVSAQDRLASVIVALERERWMNIDRGARHILVNITDYSMQLFDDGKVTFETAAVVGAHRKDFRTPEFSDEMDHMVINPTWHIPRSITVRDYLPQLQQNPHAAGHLRIIDSAGRVVPRDAVDFRQFTARTFPFAMQQPPSNSNALGLVKFMFPNKYNIYLHDTPQKNLFGQEARAFSNGCIRLEDPFEFAYILLSRQTDDPEGLFQRHLQTGREITVPLEVKVPVHLDYRTAIGRAKGGLDFRRDVYGRDARIFAALRDAGVALPAADS